MEMKYVVPDMAQSFGTLEFAGESEPVFERVPKDCAISGTTYFISILFYLVSFYI